MSIHLLRGLRLAALVAVASLLPACDDSPTSPGDVQLSFETVLTSSYSGLTEAHRAVIRNPGEWPGIWEALHAGQSPVPPLPAIDFDREMVVVAALGSRSNGCFAVEVAAITLKGVGQVEIEVVETEPGPACACTEAITHPAHVVSLERSDGSYVFQESRRRISC